MMGDRDALHRVQNYRKAVLLYEGLHAQINALLSAHGGVSEKMSPEDLALYRDLARKRDEVMNEMRWLEKQLLDDEGDTQ